MRWIARSMRRTVVAAIATLFSLACLSALDAPAYAQQGWGPVSIQRVLTRDGNGNEKARFQLGDPIQYAALINNTSGQAQSATFKFAAYAPAPPGSPTSEVQIYNWTQDASVPPGVSGWYSPSTIPLDGPASDYYHFYMTVSDPNLAFFFSADDVYFSVGTTGPTPTPPAAPTGFSATAINPNTIRLQWTDNATNATGYEISNDSTSVSVGPTATSYDWGGLAPGTHMCFTVRAVNSAGNSTWTSQACATTPAQPSSTGGRPGSTQSPKAPGLLAVGKTSFAYVPKGEPADFKGGPTSYVAPGGAIVYVVAVNNTSNRAVTGVRVTDQLPGRGLSADIWVIDSKPGLRVIRSWPLRGLWLDSETLRSRATGSRSLQVRRRLSALWPQ